MVDKQDLKSCVPKGREGSSPSPGTYSETSSPEERSVWDREVRGSIPRSPTKTYLVCYNSLNYERIQTA